MLTYMRDTAASLEAVTALMNEGVERLCDTLARVGKQGSDVNIWRLFGAPLLISSATRGMQCVCMYRLYLS